jgi:hypothetical protein
MVMNDEDERLDLENCWTVHFSPDQSLSLCHPCLRRLWVILCVVQSSRSECANGVEESLIQGLFKTPLHSCLLIKKCKSRERMKMSKEVYDQVQTIMES